MTGVWLLTALAVPALLVLVVAARGAEPPSWRLVGGGLAAGVVLGPILAPFAVVAPFAQHLGPDGSTLARAWLEAGFLEEFAKAAALWLLLVPHRVATTAAMRATGAMLISLGFGTYENLLYLAAASDPASLVLMRSLISLPAHLTAGMAAAVILLALPRPGPANATFAFLAAWFCHGTFNQWALAWAQALVGQALPDQVPRMAVLLLAGAPLAGALGVAETWRRLVPTVRGGLRAMLPWTVVTALLAAIGCLFLDGIVRGWAGRPGMLTMALPFAFLPLLLAWLTWGLVVDAWRTRRSAQIRG